MTAIAAPEEIEQTARLRAALGRISRRLRQQTQAGAALSPSQIAVLFTVARLCEGSPEGVSLGAVAEREGMHAPMASRIAASLCEAGLVERSSGAGDRRVVLLRATASGRRLRERIHRERTEALAAHVQALGGRERERLMRALPVLEELAERLEEGRR